MPQIPRWVLFSSGCAPVALTGGWTLAATLQPAGYDPMVQTISSLAAEGAADRWLMTTALLLVGACHLVTALGLRTSSPAGRATLACGGLATVLVALFPEPTAGTTVAHLSATGVAVTALALWPTLAAGRGAPVGWALKPAAGYAATALMTAGAAWFLLELHGHGAAGLAERILTGVQAVWPLIVVAACLIRIRAAGGHIGRTDRLTQKVETVTARRGERRGHHLRALGSRERG